MYHFFYIAFSTYMMCFLKKKNETIHLIIYK